MDKEVVVAITREICEKGAPKIQRVGCKASLLDISNKQHVVRTPISKDKAEKA